MIKKAFGLFAVLIASGACGKSPPKLDCSNIISAEIRAKYFTGFALTDEVMGPGVGQCRVTALSGDTSDTGRLTVDCLGKRDVAEAKNDQPDLQDLKGVGRAALVSHMFINDSYIQAWDDNSKCSVAVLVQNKIDAVALAKDVLAYYPTK